MEYKKRDIINQKNSNINLQLLLRIQNETLLITILDNIDDKKIIEDWLCNDSRAEKLIYKLDVFRLLKLDVNISNKILDTPDFASFILKNITNKTESLIDIRSYLYKFQNINYEFYTKLFLELKKYRKKLMESYDSNQGLFIDYINCLNNGIIENNDCYLFTKSIRENIENNVNKKQLVEILKRETSLKLSELIIDAIFNDNIYNVKLNLIEILRYTSDIEEKLISEEHLEFYRKVLNIDSISNDEKMEIYNTYGKHNISSMLYDDIRILKDYSYKCIEKSLITFSNDEKQKNLELSNKFGADIYELSGEKFYMLVKSMSPITRSDYNNTFNAFQENEGEIDRGCYSLIGSDNIDVYNRGFVYGFNNFPSENIISVFETDCFSRESDEPIVNERYGTTAVNRLMTPSQIVNGLDSQKKTRYSEIQITGKLNPNFIVVFDEVNNMAVSESIKLNIPIVIIKTDKYTDDRRRIHPFNDDSLQYIDFSGDRESNLRSKR